MTHQYELAKRIEQLVAADDVELFVRVDGASGNEAGLVKCSRWFREPDFETGRDRVYVESAESLVSWRRLLDA